MTKYDYTDDIEDSEELDEDDVYPTKDKHWRQMTRDSYKDIKSTANMSHNDLCLLMRDYMVIFGELPTLNFLKDIETPYHEQLLNAIHEDKPVPVHKEYAPPIITL